MFIRDSHTQLLICLGFEDTSLITNLHKREFLNVKNNIPHRTDNWPLEALFHTRISLMESEKSDDGWRWRKYLGSQSRSHSLNTGAMNGNALKYICWSINCNESTPETIWNKLPEHNVIKSEDMYHFKTFDKNGFSIRKEHWRNLSYI